MWINFTWKLIRDLWIDTTQNPKDLTKLFQVKSSLVTFTWQRCRERRRKTKLSSIPTIANSRWSLTIMIEQGSKSYSYIALAWKRIPTYPFNKRKPLCVPWRFLARMPINFREWIPQIQLHSEAWSTQSYHDRNKQKMHMRSNECFRQRNWRVLHSSYAAAILL